MPVAKSGSCSNVLMQVSGQISAWGGLETFCSALGSGAWGPPAAEPPPCQQRLHLVRCPVCAGRPGTSSSGYAKVPSNFVMTCRVFKEIDTRQVFTWSLRICDFPVYSLEGVRSPFGVCFCRACLHACLDYGCLCHMQYVLADA